MIDQIKAEKDKEYLEQTVKVSIIWVSHIFQELLNVVAGNFEIGLAIIINQHQNHKPSLILDNQWFNDEIFSVPDKSKWFEP